MFGKTAERRLPMIRKIDVERFSLTSSRPFDEVVAATNDEIGHPDMAEFWRSTHRARSVAEPKNAIQKALGKTGLMSFVQFDHGAMMRKERPRHA
jgi:predicted lipoprotein